jgi:ELWxxDGT repeat protein
LKQRVFFLPSPIRPLPKGATALFPNTPSLGVNCLNAKVISLNHSKFYKISNSMYKFGIDPFMKRHLILAALIFGHIFSYGQEKLQLVKDILFNFSGHSSARDFVNTHRYVYFTSDSKMYGRELWRTDGTPEGTVLVKDIYAGAESSNPINLTAVGDLVYFTIDDESLWVSDGSAAGTAKLLETTNTKILGSVKGKLVFTGSSTLNGNELWLTDGTLEGTVVKDIQPGVNSTTFGSSFALLNDFYFSADDGVHGVEIWKTNGTVEGTSMVKDLSSTSSTIAQIAQTSSLVFFVYESSELGRELYKTDGTTAGTTIVKDLSLGAASSSFEHFSSVHNLLYFSASGSDTKGLEMYRSDGTSNGTFMLKDIYSGITSSRPDSFVPDIENNRMYFFATGDILGRELWKTDGTTEGTVIVKDISHNWKSGVATGPSILIDGELFFQASDYDHDYTQLFELWKTNGTEEGTVKVEGSHSLANELPYNYFLQAGKFLCMSGTGFDGTITLDRTTGEWKWLQAPWGHIGGIIEGIWFNNQLIYSGGAPGVSELIKSDMTTEGTDVLKRTNIVPQSFTYNGLGWFVELDGYYYFESNHSLWRTNFTSEGTALVKEWSQEFEVNMTNAQRLGSKILFKAKSSTSGEELWTTDGTSEGTVLFFDLQGSSDPILICQHNNLVYFWATDSGTGRELYRTNGTPEGTFLLKDIYPGTFSSQANIRKIDNDIIYFTATSNSEGNELWRTNGTQEGTYLVKDIRVGSVGSNIQDLVIWNETIYFVADDGTHGLELWKSDGTEHGTELVKDINPGSASAVGYFGIYVPPFSSTAFYLNMRDDVNGDRIWKSDGTSDGTTPIDYSPGGMPLYYEHVIGSLNNQLIIQGTLDGFTQFLYISDGTAEGTSELKEIGILSSQMYAVNNRLLFVSENPAIGKELWVTDGTVAGTKPLKDIYAGPGSSEIKHFYEVGDTYYFIANDGESGVQLWQTDGTECGTKRITNDRSVAIISSLRQVGNKLACYANSVDYGPELFYYNLSAIVPAGCLQTQMITFPEVSEKSYAQSKFALNASVTSGLPIDVSSSNESVVKFDGDEMVITGAGTAIITVSQSGDYNFEPAEPIRRKITVVKIPVTVTSNVEKIYGDVLPVLALQYQGLIKGDDPQDIDTPPVGYTSATQSSDVGNYEIILSGGTDNNYEIQHVTGNLSIGKAPLEFTADYKDRIYGALNPTLTYFVNGFKQGDSINDLDKLPDISTVATIDSDAGEYPITIAGGADTNYKYEFINATLIIEKANQLVTFPAIEARAIDNEKIILKASSSSQLPVHYLVISGNIMIEENLVTMLGPGKCTVKAIQSGNKNYYAASSTQEFCVNPIKPKVEVNGGSLQVNFSEGLTFTWFESGQEINGAESFEYTPQATGNYSVKVSSGECASEVSETIRFVLTGAENDETNSITTFPNPVKHTLYLETKSAVNAVVLYKPTGEQVPLPWQNISSGLAELDLKSYPSGFYFLKIVCKDGVSFNKVVLEK